MSIRSPLLYFYTILYVLVLFLIPIIQYMDWPGSSAISYFSIVRRYCYLFSNYIIIPPSSCDPPSPFRLTSP